jgi:hypothetical protein
VFLKVFDFFNLGFSYTIENALVLCLKEEKADPLGQKYVFDVASLACLGYCIREMKDLTPYNNALKATFLRHLIVPDETPQLPHEDKTAGTIPIHQEAISKWQKWFIRAFPDAESSPPLENCLRATLSTKVYKAFSFLRGLVRGISWPELFVCKGFDPNVVIKSEFNIEPPLHMFLLRSGVDIFHQIFSKYSCVIDQDSRRDLENKYGFQIDTNLPTAIFDFKEFLAGLKALLEIPNIRLDAKHSSEETALELLQRDYFLLPAEINEEAIRLLLTKVQTNAP